MKSIITLIVLIGISTGLNAQNFWNYDDHDLTFEMPAISLVSVMPANYTVNLSLGLPRAAGASPGDEGQTVDDNTWLNYSCALRRSGSRRKVYAQVSNGTIPPGVDIDLTVQNLQTQGRGSTGRSTGVTITLSNQPQVVVQNIGGCSTRRGAQFGHQLIYELKLTDINKLKIDDTKTYLTVTYTISD